MFGCHSPRLSRLYEAEPEPEPRARRETILLVEDERAVRQLFALALTRAGYRVHEARNGREALLVFDEHGEAIDLLLTDMRMPVMGGGELVRQLRSRGCRVKLLCISGYAGEEAAFPGEFLAKPFSRNELLAKVREVLDSGEGA